MLSGNMLVLVARINGEYNRMLCELDGIRAPRLTNSATEAELRAARLSHQFLSSLALGKLVTIHSTSRQRWGRFSMEVVVDGHTCSLNEQMVTAGMALAASPGKQQHAWDWANFPVRQRNPVRPLSIERVVL